MHHRFAELLGVGFAALVAHYDSLRCPVVGDRLGVIDRDVGRTALTKSPMGYPRLSISSRTSWSAWRTAPLGLSTKRPCKSFQASLDLAASPGARGTIVRCSTRSSRAFSSDSAFLLLPRLSTDLPYSGPKRSRSGMSLLPLVVDAPRRKGYQYNGPCSCKH